MGLSGAAVNTTAVIVPPACAVAVTLSWNDDFDGGVVVYQRDGQRLRVLAAAEYPGARDPLPAGPGRVGLTYNAGRGSGQIAERTAVLCALAADNWVPCVDVMTRQEVAASGYPASDSLARDVHFTMRSDVSVVGDTLVIASNVVIKKYGRGPEIHRTLVSRHVLP